MKKPMTKERVEELAKQRWVDLKDISVEEIASFVNDSRKYFK